MRWESEFELKELIEHRTEELSSKMMSLSDGPPGAFELPEDVLTAMIELDDLESDFEFWFDNPPDSDEQCPRSAQAAATSQFRSDCNARARRTKILNK